MVGGLLLFDPNVPDLRVSRWLLVVVPTLVVAFFALVAQAALETRRRPPMIGVDLLYGEEGVALTALDPRGEVRVGHELWSAEAVGGPIASGVNIRVVGRSGLRLMVVADPNHLGNHLGNHFAAGSGQPSAMPAHETSEGQEPGP